MAWLGAALFLLLTLPSLLLHELWRDYLTLPVWMAALSPESVRVVHVVRDPYATARSIVTRNAAMELPSTHRARGEMTIADALGLWAEYKRHACAYVETFGLPRLTVWYDQVLDDARLPDRAARRLPGVSERRSRDQGLPAYARS